MKKNIGITDRIIRFTLADLLLGFSLSGLPISAFLGTHLFLAFLLLVVSVFTGYSILYKFLGINTLDESEKRKPKKHPEMMI